MAEIQGIIDEAIDQSKGGSWKNEELDAFTGWSGEKGKAKSDPKTADFKIPITRSQEDAAILAALSINDEEMAALTRQIERRMLKNAGRTATSVLASISEENREKEEKMKSWVAEASSHSSTRQGNAIESLERTVNSLNDQVTTLQRQVDEILTAQLERTEAETTMIQEAYQIIVSNIRAENDTAQTPSEAHRMEEHAEILKQRSARLGGMVTGRPISTQQVSLSANRKKKFGRL